MSRSFAPQLRIAALAVVSAMMAVAPGCSTASSAGKSAAITAPTPLPASNTARTGKSVTAAASVNNARDLAAAQPDTVLTGIASARDIDLGGGDGGGGGGGSGVQVLNMESLGAMLQGMGLTPEVDHDQFVLKVKTEINKVNYTFPITVSISPNRTLVWISCNMVQLDKGTGVTPQSLIELLSANSQLAPSFFSVDPQAWLIIQRPVTNAGITIQVLGYNLKSFLANVKASEPLYRQFMTVSGGGNQGGGGDQGGNPFQ